jgi:putative mRNA 3-end processing factor
MQLRGARRRRGLATGFALSDHADWPGLQWAIDACGAKRVLVTHGYVAPMVRWLRERGLDAAALDTEFGGDDDAVAGETARDDTLREDTGGPS